MQHTIKLKRINKSYFVTKNGKEFEFSTLRACFGFIQSTRPYFNWPNKE